MKALGFNTDPPALCGDTLLRHHVPNPNILNADPDLKVRVVQVQYYGMCSAVHAP